MSLDHASIDHTAIDHARNVIRRQVQEEIPALTPIIVLHDGDNRATMIERSKTEISQNFGGGRIMSILQSHADATESEFIGILHVEKPSLPLMPPRRFLYAMIFINIAELETPDDARLLMYSLAWQAMTLAQDHMNPEHETARDEDGMIRPDWDPLTLAKHNLAAEVFATLMIELQGTEGFIQQVAQDRLRTTLTRVPGAHPERYPFPIVMDTLQIVHDDLQESFNPKARIISQALQFTEEVMDTHEDENSVRQWWAFAEAAQEMAWMEFEVDDILSAATYTSEDPYVRATAHMVADFLGRDPSAISDLGSYNPFTDSEANMRAHKRACDKTLDAIMPREFEDYVLSRFRAAIQEQNKRLSQGFPLGWNARALDILIGIVEKHKAEGSPPPPVKDLRDIYDKERETVPWHVLLKANKLILREYRERETLSSGDVLSILGSSDDFRTLHDMYEKYAPTTRNFIKKSCDQSDPIFGEEPEETTRFEDISQNPHPASIQAAGNNTLTPSVNSNDTADLQLEE